MLTVDEIQKRIATKNAKWQSGETAFFKNFDRSAKGSSRLGLKISFRPEVLRAASNSLRSVANAPIPDRVDWRTDKGGKVTAIKDQGTECGSCVAFAVCAAMESAYLIKSNVVTDLSEAHLFFCNGGSCDDGWEIAPALQAAQAGVGWEADFPYVGEADCVATTPRLKVTRYGVHSTMDARKRAVAKGPVIAALQIFEDFLSYTGGVYEYVTGDNEGGHAVCVVGYDDEQQCWIVKNSWGTEFGEDGYFRIKYGECLIDTLFPFYSIQAAEF